LFHALVELCDLHVHRPDHLVHAVGLNDGMFDGVLLAFERLRLVRHVLGERVQSGQTLLGALAQLVEPRERPELRLDFLNRRHRGRRVLARLARRLADLRVVLRERRRDRADLIEIGLERAGAAERLLHFGLGLLQLTAQLLERRALFLQRVERGLRAERLRRQVLDRFAMLLQLAVGSERLARRLLRLLGLLLERIDPRVDLLELARAIVERREPSSDVAEPRRHAGRLLRDLLERLAERGQLRAARGERRQHRADGAALLASRRNQRFELVGLLLNELGLAATSDVLEGVQHVRFLRSSYRRFRRDAQILPVCARGYIAVFATGSAYYVLKSLKTRERSGCNASCNQTCACLPAFARPPYSASTRVPSTSKSTCHSGCRCSRWWACPTQASARAASVFVWRFATPGSSTRPTASPSICRRPTSGRRAPRSTCRSRSAFWRQPASSNAG